MAGHDRLQSFAVKRRFLRECAWPSLSRYGLGVGSSGSASPDFVPLCRGGELAVDERAFRLALSVGVPMNRRPAWFAVLEFNRAAEVTVVPPGFPAAMLHAIFVTALGLFPALDCPPLGLAGVRLRLADDVPTLFLQLKTMLLDETFAFGLANRRRGGNRLGSRLGLRGGCRGRHRLNGLRRFRLGLRNRLEERTRRQSAAVPVQLAREWAWFRGRALAL